VQSAGELLDRVELLMAKADKGHPLVADAARLRIASKAKPGSRAGLAFGPK